MNNIHHKSLILRYHPLFDILNLVYKESLYLVILIYIEIQKDFFFGRSVTCNFLRVEGNWSLAWIVILLIAILTLAVTSCHTPMTIVDNPWLVPSHGTPLLSLPHDFWESHNFSSMLKLRCHQVPTLSFVYIIVYLHSLTTPNLCISPYSDPVSPIHVYTALLCSLATLYSLTPSYGSDSIYKTPVMYVIQYVWISSLIIVLIVYSTSCYVP